MNLANILMPRTPFLSEPLGFPNHSHSSLPRSPHPLEEEVIRGMEEGASGGSKWDSAAVPTSSASVFHVVTEPAG